MAEEDTRVFVPDPTPEGMAPAVAEWILRQLYRITGSSSEITFRQEEGADNLNAHIQNTNNPHQTTHALLPDRGVNDHAAIDAHIASTANPHQTTHAILPDVTGPAYNPHGMMRWRDNWLGSTDFHQYDVVERNRWLMVANKTTQDDPAPSPAGNRQWLTGLGDTPSWTSASVSTTLLHVGLRLTTPADEAYFRYTVRVWIPTGAAGQGLALWVVDDPLGAEGEPQFISVMPERVIQAGEENAWLSFGIGTNFLPLGRTFDVIAAFSSENSSSSFADDWDAKRKNDDDVSDGEVWHGDVQAIGSRFSYLSQTGSQMANLRSLSPGDEFDVQGSTYAIDGVEDDVANTSVVVYSQPHCRPAENTYTYTFRTVLPATIGYVHNGTAWSGNPNVQGLFSSTGYQNIAADEVMYGVDIELEGVVVSPDWDFMAYSG